MYDRAEKENRLPESLPTDRSTDVRVDEIARVLSAKPFEPFGLFRGGHAQTIGGYAWPRWFDMTFYSNDERRLFEVEPGIQMLGHCKWMKDRVDHPTVIFIHGLEGSSDARYMLGTAAKALQAGFNTIRLNLRNCGGTEHLAPTLYNSGMSGDLLSIVTELIERDGLKNIFLVGHSMSGNLVLKLAGENGPAVVDKIAGICAISPSVDLSACAAAIESRSNWLYRRSFMRSLHKRIKQKALLFPELYDVKNLHLIRTIREFDERYTAVDGGFANADEYYERASALQFIRNIQIPALIVHAEDDPFIPFHSFRDPSITANRNVILLAPKHGGHLGFVASETESEDRFWSENRVVEFCVLVNKTKAGTTNQL